MRGNNTAWAQAMEIIPPKTGINETNAILVKCSWVIHKNDTYGLVKYFRVSSFVTPREVQ